MIYIFRNSTLYLRILFLLVSIAFVNTVQANDDQSVSDIKYDYLLVINTYTVDAPWSNALIECVQKWVSTERDIAVFVEHLNMLMIDTDTDFRMVEEAIFSKYSNKSPKAVLLLGNGTLPLKNKIRTNWGDMPLIMCAEEDFFGPDEYYFNRCAIPEEERVPLSTLADSFNMTVLQTKIFPHENIELLKYMIPRLKDVLLIGDGRYINQQLDYDIRQMMKREYPELKYRFLSAADMRLEELMSFLGKIDTTSTGV